MSLSLHPVDIQQALDPRTNLGERICYNVFKGGSTVTQQPTSATSFSTSQVNYSINPPSPFVIVDRRLYQVWNVQFTFAGTSAAGNLLNIGVSDAPRSFPIHRAINTASVQINNATASLTVFPVLTALQFMNLPKAVRRLEYSGSPVMPDQFQQYAAGQGAIRNPLGSYLDESFEIARGGFQSMTVVSNTPTAAVVNCVFIEPMLVSPLSYGTMSQKGFFGVQNLSINLTLNGNLSRMWSHDAVTGNAVSSIAVAFLAPPMTLITWITPNPVVQIPKQLAYSYFLADYYNSDMASTLAAGSSTTLVSNTITFTEIPRQLLIFVRQRDADLTFSTSDVFGVINSMSLTLNNQSGILASASQYDLYRMSMENGVDIEWPSWSTLNQNGVGSLVCIVPGKDIGLPPTLSSGVGGQFSFQATVNFSNPVGNPAIQYSLYILPIREGIWEIEQNRSIPLVNVITPEDVLRSNSTAPISMAQRSVVNAIYGGDFFGNLKSIGRKIGLAGNRVIPYLEQGLPYVKRASKYLSELKGGRRRRVRRGGSLADDSEFGFKPEAADRRVLRGGQMISREDLLDH